MQQKAFLIPLPGLFSYDECLWFLHRNYDDCMHTIEGQQLYKAVRIDNRDFLVQITQEAEALKVVVLSGAAGKADQEKLTAYIIEWLDLDRDLAPFYKLLKKDKRVSYMAADFKGLRMIGIPDLFEALCWSVTGQQINLSFAYKLKRRLVERYGTSIEYEGRAYHIFPTPQALADASAEELRGMQFSTSKTAYLISIATAFAKGSISKEQLKSLPDVSSRQQQLIAMKGIGIWTANYSLMKSLKEPGSIPYGDAGLLNALVAHGIMADKKDVAALDQFFARFPGWESYIVFYLWRSLATKSCGGT